LNVTQESKNSQDIVLQITKSNNSHFAAHKYRSIQKRHKSGQLELAGPKLQSLSLLFCHSD
jgi:hypothetical protein